MTCLLLERIIGFTALAIGVTVFASVRPLSRRWGFQFPGVPFMSGWAFMACCALGFAAAFLAWGFGVLPQGKFEFVGCDP